jgi:hypothetical protein
MNRIGGKSNTGEGGEDPARYRRSSRASRSSKGQTLADIMGKDVVEVDYRCKTATRCARASSRWPRAALA